MEHTRFRIAGLDTGWMNWRVTGPDMDEKVAASWVGYPTLDPMLRLATSMLIFRKERYFWHLNTVDWDDFVISFPGEPECYHATFGQPEGDIVPFLLERCDDDMGTPHAPYVKVGSGTVSMDQFAVDLLTDSFRLLREWGIVGFRDLWVYSEFPISEFLRLVQARDGGEPCRSGLAQELTLMTAMLNTPDTADGGAAPVPGQARL